MSIIPYIINDERGDDTGKNEKCIHYSSVSEEKLQLTLLKELHYAMEYHCFFDNSDDDEYDDIKELTCSECECIVISKKFIHNINDALFCCACNPSETIGNYITKKIFDEFIQFLDKKDEICDILYFKNNEWVNFVIE
jgi:hypothetical protein